VKTEKNTKDKKLLNDSDGSMLIATDIKPTKTKTSNNRKSFSLIFKPGSMVKIMEKIIISDKVIMRLPRLKGVTRFGKRKIDTKRTYSALFCFTSVLEDDAIEQGKLAALLPDLIIIMIVYPLRSLKEGPLKKSQIVS
jgi:hypothetical protein